MSCIRCRETDDFFNITTQQCESCDQYFEWNKETRECERLPANSSNPDASGSISGPIGSGVPCLPEEPYFNGAECINCEEPNPIFNSTTKKCVSCEFDESWHQDERKCIKLKPNGTNPAADDTVLG